MTANLGFSTRVLLAALVLTAAPAIAGARQSTTKPVPPAAGAPVPAAPAPEKDQPDADTSTDQQTEPLPIDVDHIKREAQKPPAVRLDDKQLRFYVLVLAKAPKFDDLVGDYDLKNGPTRGGAAMTHQEFLNMVTPKELKELFGGTNANSFALFQAAVMNAVGQSLIRKAILDIRAARDEREVAAIRARIDRELAALLGRDR